MHTEWNEQVPPDGVAHLWELAAGGVLPEEATYGEEMKADVLASCLDERLPTSGTFAASLPPIARSLCRKLSPEGRSIRQVFQDPHADLQAIRLIKDHAKRLAAIYGSGPEHAAAIAIYFAGIAHALVFHGQKITSHDYHYLRSALDEIAARSWVPGDLRELFLRAAGVCDRTLP